MQFDDEHLSHTNNTISRRGFLKLCTVAAGAVIAGCAPRNVPGARVTLTQWYHEYGQAGTQQAVMRYAADYTKQNPDVAIRIIWVPGDYQTKVATAMLTPYGPDIFEGQFTIPQVTAGQIADLSDFYADGVQNDFLPQDIAVNQINGKIYGVKSMSDTGVLYYRPSLLAKAGVEPPKTCDELLAAVKKLTNGNTKGLYLGNDGGITSMLTVTLWAAGSDCIGDNKVLFNTPGTVAAYEFLRELNNSGGLLLGAPTDWWEPSALTQGLAAMQWCGLWAFPDIKAALKDDIGVLPWPALSPQYKPSTFLGGWSTAVNAQGQHVDEAKKYLKWLFIDNKAAQLDWNLGYGFHIPPRISVAKSATKLQAPLPAAVVSNVHNYGHFLPPGWSASMNTALTDALTNIVKTNAPAANEVRIAYDKCVREMERELE